VSAVGGSGNYRTTTKFTGHEIAGCTYVQTLDLNRGFIQILGPRSCRGEDGQPVDYYGFTLGVDSLVALVMTSSAVDSHLTLYDSKGAVLRFDDNGYGGADSLIIQYLPAGTYKLAARDISGGPGGIYRVDLLVTPGPRPALCGSRAPISLGSSVTGAIGYSGCQYNDATFADVYTLSLAADTAVELRANSTDFDAYVILLDAKGNLIDQDDDSGGGTNARVTQLLAAGTYYVVVKPFSLYTSGGTYSLAAKALN
jgi:tyrosinase